MSKTVIINDVIYNDVAEVKIPLAADTSQRAVYLDTSDATATAAQITKDATAYVNGVKLTGTRTDPSFSLTNGVLSIA